MKALGRSPSQSSFSGACSFSSSAAGSDSCMETYSVLYSSYHRSRLLCCFQRLRAQGKMCDVTLEAGGVSFPCHRALLASSSDFFWALFGDTSVERDADSVSLPALTSEGLDVILDFLYSGWLSISTSSLPVVVEAARYLQVEPAVSICEQFMVDGVTAENCCSYANLAERHALTKALEAANQTIAKEMRDILHDQRDDLLGLNVQSLMEVLEASEIPGVREVELVKLTVDWLHQNGPLPLLKSNLLLSRLRFGLVAPGDLADASRAHRGMTAPLIRSQLTRAAEYHQLGPTQPVTQSKHSTLRASADRVVLLGGGASADCPERQVLAFDPRSRRFSAGSFSLPLRLRHPCSCSVGGFLFVFGGEEVRKDSEDEKRCVAVATCNQVWRYDPRFDRWAQLDSLLERRSHFSCCVVGGVIYAVGGRRLTPDSHRHTSLASVEFYDMTVGAWRRGANMPRPLHSHASAALDGHIFVCGGLSGRHGATIEQNQDQRREISKDCLSWDRRGRVWEKRASMSIPRFSHHLASARGHIYALLGMYEPFCDIERYHPQSDHWTRLRPLVNGSFNYGMVSTAAGSLLVFGGSRWSGGQEVPVRSVMEYDTKKDVWKEIAQLPRPLTGIECSLLPLPD